MKGKDKDKSYLLQPGNQLWRLRKTSGKPKLFETPEELWEEACKYFEWCDANPLIEHKPMSVSHGMNMGSEIEMAEIPRIRAYTLGGLCIFLGLSESYFRSFKVQERENKKAYMEIIDLVEAVIYNQKFTGAAANLLNSAIIARELGLKERTDHTTNDQPLTPPQLIVYNGSAPGLADTENDIQDKKGE